MSLNLRLVAFIFLSFGMCLLPAVLAYFLLPQTNLYQGFGIAGIIGAIGMVAKVQKQLADSDEDFPED